MDLGTFERLKYLKDEHGVTASEAFFVIKNERQYQAIAEEAAKSVGMSTPPSVDLIARVCDRIEELLHYYFIICCAKVQLEYGLVFKDIQNIFSAGHFFSCVSYRQKSRLEINTGELFFEIFLDWQEIGNEEVEVIARNVEAIPCFIDPQAGREERRIFGIEEITPWLLDHQEEFFFSPGSNEYNEHIGNIRNSGTRKDRTEILELSDEELVERYANANLMIFERMLIVEKNNPLVERSSLLGMLYPATALYRRAENEHALGQLWVERRIVVAYLMEHLDPSEISEETIKQVISDLDISKEISWETLVKNEDREGKELLNKLHKQQMKMEEYIRRALIENETWLLRYFGS